MRFLENIKIENGKTWIRGSFKTTKSIYEIAKEMTDYDFEEVKYPQYFIEEIEKNYPELKLVNGIVYINIALDGFLESDEDRYIEAKKMFCKNKAYELIGDVKSLVSIRFNEEEYERMGKV